MSDDKPSDNDNFNEDFGEDFNFGEEQFDDAPSQQSKSTNRDSTKKVLFLFVAVALAIIVGVGYRFYSAPSKLTMAVNQLTSTPTPSPTTPEPKTLPPSKPTKIAKEMSVKPQAKPTASSSVSSPSPPEEIIIEDELAEAFTNTDIHPVAQQPSASASAPPPSTLMDQTTSLDLTIPTTSPLRLTGPSSESLLDVKTQEDISKLSHTDEIHDQQIMQVSEALLKLNSQIDYLFNKIKNLDTYSHDVSDSLNQLNDAVVNIDQQLVTLTNATSSLSKDMGDVKKEVTHVKKVLKEDGLYESPDMLSHSPSEVEAGRVIMEEPEYKVHAIIPGRAWLKSSKGQIVTVAEGDALGNYGKVLVIDAGNGIVLTSSGIAFR